MIRSFLPVGQGACYLEQFEIYKNKKYNRINIMYDCGSSTSLEVLKNCLSDNLDDNETIHAVFISHFDEDHINGLPLLLKNYKVDNLFIPLITEEEKKILQLSCLCDVTYNSNQDFFEEFFDSYPYIHNCGNVYFVEPTGFTDNDLFLSNGWDIQHSIIRSGTNVVNRMGFDNENELFEWEYVPFNFRQKSRYSELIDELKKEFEEDIDLDIVWQLVKSDNENIKKFKNAYCRISGSMNTNTMVLYSGTKNKNIIQRIYNRNCRGCPYPCCDMSCQLYSSSGCLYTGDYDASGNEKWQELKTALNEYWNTIGCVQIPHHGSKHSYNAELINCCNSRFYIISAGKNNRYRHPHSFVVKDMLFKGIQPFIVSEEKNSETIFIVH